MKKKKSNPGLVQLNIRVPKELKEALKDISNSVGLAVEDLAADAIAAHYELWERSGGRTPSNSEVRRGMVMHFLRQHPSFNKPDCQPVGEEALAA